MTRAVLLDDYLDQARSLPCVQALAQRLDLQIYTTKASSEAETIERTRQADIIITIRDRVVFTPSLLARLCHIQLLSVCGTRLTHIDLEAATRYGVPICTAAAKMQMQGSATKTGTAEQTWNLILALLKDTPLNDRAVRAGHWQTRLTRGVAGKTLGLLGLGEIGRQVADIAQAMRMRVIASSPRLTPERAAASSAEYVPFRRLFMDADVLSLHAPLTPENHNLVGEEELSLMRPHAVLVNTARAGLVQEQALRQALERGTIAGAGFDVYWEEPLPVDHWLRRQDNVVLQPHVGGFTETGYSSLLEPAIANVVAFLDGRPQGLVNPQVLARRRPA